MLKKTADLVNEGTPNGDGVDNDGDDSDDDGGDGKMVRTQTICFLVVTGSTLQGLLRSANCFHISSSISYLYFLCVFLM